MRLVRWKPQGDKLVSYDSWGNIRGWKNRSKVFALDFQCTVVQPVSDIQWSPCGTYIALCGEEGQVQVMSGHDGAVIFAINAVSTTGYGAYAEFTSLSWNSTSTRIALGTGKGEVIEVDPHNNGRFLSMMSMHENVPVRQVDYFGSLQYFFHPDAAGRPASVVVDGQESWVASQSLSLYMEDGEVAIFPLIAETHCYCVQVSESAESL